MPAAFVVVSRNNYDETSGFLFAGINTAIFSPCSLGPLTVSASGSSPCTPKSCVHSLLHSLTASLSEKFYFLCFSL